MKELLDQKTVEKVKDTVEKVAEKIPDDMLAQVAGAGNPFENVPRVPTQPIDSELRDKA